MPTDETPGDAQDRAVAVSPDADDVRAWEEVEPGRFMPRRVRGSFRGGKLGWAFVLPSGPDGTTK